MFRWRSMMLRVIGYLRALERNGSRLKQLRFEFSAAVLKPWPRFLTIHCSSSLSCINEYLTIGSGDYVYEESFAH